MMQAKGNEQQQNRARNVISLEVVNMKPNLKEISEWRCLTPWNAKTQHLLNQRSITATTRLFALYLKSQIQSTSGHREQLKWKIIHTNITLKSRNCCLPSKLSPPIENIKTDAADIIHVLTKVPPSAPIKYILQIHSL